MWEREEEKEKEKRRVILSPLPWQALVSQLEELYTRDKKAFSLLPSEMLYGHTGYLYAVLFVNSYIPGAIGDEIVEEVRRWRIDLTD